MSYRFDNDLEFFRELESEDLNELVRVLTYDKEGELRYTEQLTSSDVYKRYYPDHNKYWDKIAEEIQRFGGNTFANLFRGGKGVFYKEVLTDVCNKLKIEYNSNDSTQHIENALLLKILKDIMDNMDEKQFIEFAKSLGTKNTNGITPQILLGSFQTIFKLGGFKSYQLTVVIANAIAKVLLGKGLSLGANALITRTMAIITGPIGIAITTIWTLFDIASPAFRVTIPAVIFVAYLRKKHEYLKIKGNNIDLLKNNTNLLENSD